MFEQKNRIKKKKEIEEILKKGKNFKQDLLVLKTKKNSFNFPRFGIIVSKKVSKKAVIRNKTKRRIREIIKPLIKTFNNSDNLFIVLPGLEKKQFKEIKETIGKLLKKLN